MQPHVLQRMMIAGGLALVVGLVGWLWSIGTFDHPIAAAIGLGGACLIAIGSGIALHRFTRYQLAGTGFALLGSLALPLNLWLYDSQGLIRLAEGGHLWIPAALCCAIYAGIAREFRNPVFVYHLVGGIVMTGLLILADQSIDRIADLLVSAGFVVSVGWTCIAIGKWCSSGKEELPHDRFGRAFRNAGFVLVLTGLAPLAFVHAAQFLNDSPVLNILEFHTRDRQPWVLALLGVSTLATFFHSFPQPAGSKSTALGGLLACWFATGLLGYLGIQPHLAMYAIAIHVVVIVRQLVLAWNRDGIQSDDAPGHRNWLPGLVLALAFLGVAQFGISVIADPRWWPLGTSITLVAVQLFLASVSSTLEVTSCSPQARERRALFLNISSVLAAFALLCTGRAIGIESMEGIILAGLVAPLLFSALQWLGLARSESSWQPHAATAGGVALGAGVLVLFAGRSSPPVSAAFIASMLAATSALALVAPHRRLADRVIGHAAMSGALCLWADFFGLWHDVTIPSILFIGAVLAAFAGWVVQAAQGANPLAANSSRSIFKISALYLTSSSLLAIFLGFFRALTMDSEWIHALLLLVQFAALLVARQASRDEWRQGFDSLLFASACALASIGLFGLQVPVGYRVELFTVVAGLAALVAGHVGWARESEDQPSDATSTGLILGSVLTSIPLIVGLFTSHVLDVHELTWYGSMHKWGVPLVAVILLLAGISCRIRATTLAGAAMIALYALIMVRIPHQLANTSLLVMACGGLFFLAAVLLSIYREYVLALPEKIRRGEGVFGVIRWR